MPGVPNFPQTLPAQTVIGNLAATPKEAQAIPIAALSGQLADASTINFTPAGAGAVARPVSSKLGDIVALADYDTLAHYNAAVSALPNTGNYTFGGLLNARGLNSLVSGGGKIWFGINTIPSTGTFEIGDTPLAALKVVGTTGQTDDVEIALVQDQGGLRTYGGFFLVKNTSSDLTWTRRVNLVDTEVLRIANATGNVGIVGNLGSSSAPVSFKFNIARNSSLDFTELGLFSATNTLVAGIGTDGAVTNDLRIASIGDIHFYPQSTIASGSTPTNEKGKVTTTGFVNFDTNLMRSATTLANNAAAQTATMTNGPTAGNPTKWIPINDNGTTRNIPAW